MSEPAAHDDPFPPEYLAGLQLMNNGYFWHAHEELEDIWNESDGVDRDFYQGLIQVAAACFHIVRSNWSGADKLLHMANANLASAAPTHRGLDVQGVLDHCDVLLDAVYSCRYGRVDGFDRALFPRLVLEGGPDVTGPLEHEPQLDEDH